MYNGEDEELRRIRENLLGGRADPDQGSAEIGALADLVLRKYDDLESGLRALGLNRREREDWRRHGASPKPRSSDRDRATALKRIRYYIDEQVDWTKTSANRIEVLATWAVLSNYDVDKVKEWFSKGVDPLSFAEVFELGKNDFRPQDLFTEISGKTVAQHLREGSSAQWCLHALHFARQHEASMRNERP
ncbi:hypothetical protein [Micromonospora arida]